MFKFFLPATNRKAEKFDSDFLFVVKALYCMYRPEQEMEDVQIFVKSSNLKAEKFDSDFPFVVRVLYCMYRPEQEMGRRTNFR